MTIPTKIATWFMIVFFLLIAFVQFTGGSIIEILTAVAALGAAIFLFLDK